MAKDTKLIINHKRIYEVDENGNTFWVLILYDISGYHHFGLKVLKKELSTTFYLESINYHVNLYGMREYKYSMFKRCIYKNKKPLEITDDELDILYKKTKESIISYLEGQIYPNVDNLMYLKWCKDVYILNHNTISAFFSLKQNAIYWINMGYGVGSEIRKIRPAILWRKTKDSAMCTIIPLTSKNYDDKLYFHYDLKNTIDSTAKIEYLTNISTKRILSPYYSKNKMTFISNEDREKIILIIEQYYLFKNLTKADKKQ